MRASILALLQKTVKYFQRRKEQMMMSVKVLKIATTQALCTYRIAKEKEPFTYAEKLILPSTVDTVSTVLDGKLADKIKWVPLSDTTL